MPCFTMRSVPVAVTVAFNAENAEILINGLRHSMTIVSITATTIVVSDKSGRRATIDRTRQTITVGENEQSLINEVKRAYSGEVVRQSAKRFGWTLNKTNDANTVVAKRRF